MPIKKKIYKKKNARNYYGTYKRSGPYVPKYKAASYAPAPSEMKSMAVNTGLNANQMQDINLNSDWSLAAYRLLLVNSIAQGADMTNRIGNKIYCEYIELRGEVENVDVDVGNPHAVKITAFIDYTPAGVEATYANVYDTSTTTGTGTTYAIHALRNLNFRDKYKVLAEYLINLAPAATTAAHVLFHYFIPVKVATTYNGAAAGIATIMANAVYVGCVSDQADGSQPVVTWKCQARLRYRDS